MSNSILPFPSDLTELLADIWRMLVRGAADPKDDLHWPGLTTLGLQQQPQSRIVVLRAARPADQTLEIHTDTRSLKVRELQANPVASLLFYRPRSRVQLRVLAQATLHQGDTLANQRWQALGEPGQLLYRTPVEPGITIDSPEQALAEPLPAHLGEKNFVVILLQVQQLEWLELARPVHRRALFTYTAKSPATPSSSPPTASFNARWIAP